MAWTEIARRRYSRGELRYASNLTDAEWSLIEPFMPAPSQCGRPRSVSLRVIVEAILYMLATGCQWRQIPREFAPFTLCRRLKKGAQGQDFGRSRGGFSTKIHLRTNAEGLPIGIILSPGEAHDSTAYADLMDERDSDPGILLADRGYDSDAIRQDARDRGTTPEIPTKRNRRIQHSVARSLYALRNRIERCFNKLKNNRRIATRYNQTSSSFLGFVLLSSIKLWIQFVHAA